MLVAGPAVRASILNDQEQAIANNMINDPDQKRPFLNLDPILAAVARARAEDMAKRNYFSHVNPDGVAANYLVRQAGYVLPDWWGTSPTDNYIESIAAGYSTPQAAWNGWMNSPGHRTHIIGLDPFYAAETSYGVGYYYDASSTYKHYWVILTAPPAPASKLVITTPGNGSQFTTPQIEVAGTTNDSNTAAVEVRIENTTGNSDYLTATGIGDWSATLSGFAPGTNTIRARSLNASGAVIAEATRTVTYVEMGLLTVNLSGSGTATAGFTGTTSRQVGKSVTITATPAAGSLFAGWSGDVTSKSATLTFVMQHAITLQANFSPNFFPDLRGVYTGLITTGSNDHNGFLRISSGPTGAFSGSFQLDGKTYRLRGRFDTDGRATVTINRSNANPLVLNLQLDTADGANQISGTISDGVFMADISADRAVFNARTAPAPQAGRYTVVLASNANFPGPQNPQGNGFATLTVGADGSVRIAGRTGDGTPFAQLSMVSQDGVTPVYVPLYAYKGSLAGSLTFEPTSEGDLDGTLNWMKPARPKDVFYPDGFTMPVPTVGSLYTKPAANVPVMNFTNGTVTLGNGNLDAPIAQAASLSSASKVAVALPNPQTVSLTINTSTGLVAGKFIHPADTKARAVLGVVLQKQNSAYGFFPGVDQCGFIGVGAVSEQN